MKLFKKNKIFPALAILCKAGKIRIQKTLYHFVNLNKVAETSTIILYPFIQHAAKHICI